MSDAESVILRLRPRRKARNALPLTQRGKSSPPTGQQLVRVCLMADVPNHLVHRQMKYAVKRKRQLHRAETWRKMAPRL